MAATMMIDTNKEAVVESDNETREESWCPLFSEGLPSDFASNTKLAAIASLLNDDNSDNVNSENEDEMNLLEDTNGMLQPNKILQSRNRDNINSCRSTKDAPMTVAGGGKARQNKRRQRKAGAPYDNKRHTKSSSAKTASVGEAQLFLNLWKI